MAEIAPVICDVCFVSDVDVLYATGVLPEWQRDTEGCVVCDECRHAAEPASV